MTSLSINAAIAREVELATQANPNINPADIAFLLGERLNFTPSQLRLRGTTELSADQLTQFEADVKQLIDGASPQYILGYAWFLGEKLKVNENVLIPRFETEELVDWVATDLAKNSVDEKVDLLDVGTGSGAILVGLNSLVNTTKISYNASDISPAALGVAEQNFADYGLQVNAAVADVLAGLGEFDVIISNPPYIMENEVAVMDESVVQNEPHIALFAGIDGLDFYRKFVKQINAHLRFSGSFYLEFGYHQKQLLAELFASELPDYEITFKQDMSGHDRMVRGRKK